MYGNGRKTIGVFICEVSFFFQSKLCQAISKQAGTLGYNVAFFTCYNDYKNSTEYAAGEFNIAKLPDYESFAGVIIAPDTFKIPNIVDYITTQINERCNCPIVSIRRKIDGYYNVLINDDNAMEGIVRHLVEEHQYSKIAFLSGPKGFPDADKRLDSYKRILSEYHIPINEDYIYYSDFWKTRSKITFAHFTQPGMERPEAIVCANDYMAISLCHEFINNSILVPDDIAVTGFDNVKDAIENIPSLTTVDMPVEKMGLAAIAIIDNVLHNKPQPPVTYIDTEDIYRESCGCISTDDPTTLMKNRTRLLSEIDNSVDNQGQIRYMSIDLEASTSLQEICNVYDGYLFLNNNFSNYFLCLCNDDSLNSNDITPVFKGFTPNMSCPLALIDKKRSDNIDFFETKTLIPPQFIDSTPQIYYFIPLHYQKNLYGYTAISFSDYDCLTVEHQSLTTTLCNSLENIRVKNELNHLLVELKDLYIRDPLTYLYNRRGFEKMAIQYFNKSIENKKSLMILVIDMDGLKYVNDRFGHLQGDIAIKSISDALKHAAIHDELCCRVGGDEFNIIGYDYSEEKKDIFMERFYGYLKDYNNTSEKAYIVDASYGCTFTSHEDNKTIEEYLNQSDARMYLQKTKKKAKRYQ